MVKIKQLQIKAIRGISSLDLNFDEKNVIIKGDNGSGKSSIVESLEFFFTGKVSSLEETIGVTLKRNLSHSKYSIKDSEVTVIFNPGTHKTTRNYKSISDIPPELESYFQGIANGKFMLTRAELIKFVLAKPRDRFEAIASILGTEDLDNIEKTLHQISNDLRGQKDEIQIRLDDNFFEISNILGVDISELDEILPIINEKRSKLDLKPLEYLNDLKQSTEKQFPEIHDIRHYQTLENIFVFKGQLEKPFIDEISSKLIYIDEKISELLLKRFTKYDEKMTSFLNTGIVLLKMSKEEYCPLCGLSINTKKLIEDITTRLSTLAQLSKDAEYIRIEIGQCKEKVNQSIRRLETIEEIINKIEDFKKYDEEIKKSKIDLLQIIEELEEKSDFIIKEKKFDIIETYQKINHIRSIILEEVNIIIKQEYSGYNKELLEFIKITGQLQNIIRNITDDENLLELVEKKFIVANNMDIAFSKIKRQEIESIYSDIKSDINDYYKILHSNDPTENIDITLSKERSTNISIDFSEKKSIHPKAYLSEGHIDSLGLCVFLAFVKKFNQACTLLILDDVVSTIDAGHREYIGELLKQYFSNYQILITTHDSIWFSQLTNYLPFKQYEITKWSIDEGPYLSQYQPQWDYIQTQLDQGNKKVGYETRTYLEWILKTAAKNTRAKLIYKPEGNLMISDLFFDVKDRFNKLIRDDTKRDEIINKFSKLEKRKFMANLLAHDNVIAENFSLDEIRRFCNSVHELRKSLSCKECESMLIYPADVKRLQCSNTSCTKPTIILCK